MKQFWNEHKLCKLVQILWFFLFICRYTKSMKTLVSVYAGSPQKYAFEPVFAGKSAFDRLLKWIDSLSQIPQLHLHEGVIFTCPDYQKQIEDLVKNCSIPLKVLAGDFTTVSSFLSALDSCKGDCTSIVHSRYSCPFYDPELTKELFNFHHKYAAEYTFTEGWPEGLAPVVVNGSTVSILKTLSETKDFGSVGRDVFFDVIRSDINSFEVETLMAPEDMRQYRLDFSCHSKEGLVACARLFQVILEDSGPVESPEFAHALTANKLASEAIFVPSVLRTVPAFYNVQISAACPGTCSYCPYPKAYEAAFHHSPAEASEKNPQCFMKLEQFKALVPAMAELSGEAVVSLSLWGEPLAHPDFIGFVEAVLAQPGLSVLVETDGSLVTEELSQKIRSVVDSVSPRTNGHPAIMWIVSLDSQNQQMYQSMRGAGSPDWPISHEQAQKAFQILSKDFPGASYVQFVRTKTNEEQLEDFYRSRKDCGGLIIQKYDNFMNYMPDQQVTDLSPVVRNPCWHQRRDMVILVDGKVPLCREFLLAEGCGNVFSQSLKEIWQNGQSMPFMDECEQCDEYYTFNF